MADAFFALGNWSFRRHISQPLLQFDGYAQLSLLPNGQMEYSESGQYVLDGQFYPFQQRQLWEASERQLYIYKNDGQLLHIFSLANGQQMEHTHYCGADVYQCQLTIYNNDQFELHYNIQGPHKNYLLTTKFTRA